MKNRLLITDAARIPVFRWDGSVMRYRKQCSYGCRCFTRVRHYLSPSVESSRAVSVSNPKAKTLTEEILNDSRPDTSEQLARIKRNQPSSSADQESVGERLRLDVFGWYDGKAKEPSHDPGVENGICALCGKQLSRPVITTNLLPDGSNRSYFYRCHKSCHLNSTEAERDELDSMIVDSVLGRKAQ